jgi:hypothetical protein
MVVFSPGSMQAYAALYRPYNDIDIFVEDRSLVGLYERVFSRLLDGVARIASVTPLHGRRAVIEEAIRVRRDRSRKRFFLLDGDFEWVFGRYVRFANVYTLKCYSFENLAWELPAIYEAARTLAPDLPEGEVTRRLSHQHLHSIVRTLLPLFVLYAVCWKLDAPVLPYATPWCGSWTLLLVSFLQVP